MLWPASRGHAMVLQLRKVEIQVHVLVFGSFFKFPRVLKNFPLISRCESFSRQWELKKKGQKFRRSGYLISNIVFFWIPRNLKNKVGARFHLRDLSPKRADSEAWLPPARKVFEIKMMQFWFIGQPLLSLVYLINTFKNTVPPWILSFTFLCLAWI